MAAENSPDISANGKMPSEDNAGAPDAGTGGAPTHSGRANRLPRLAFFLVLGFAVLAMTVAGILWVSDFRLEDDYELAIREYASANRGTDLRFPGAAWSPIRPRLRSGDGFDFSASALSIAEQELADALKRNPSDSRLLYLQAQIHLLYLREAPAIDILNRLLPFSPNDPDLLGALAYAHYLRGRQQRSMRDLLRSIDLFEKALEQRPVDEVLLFNAATAYQRARMHPRAEQLYRQLLQRDSEGNWAREVKGRLREVASDEEKAKPKR